MFARTLFLLACLLFPLSTVAAPAPAPAVSIPLYNESAIVARDGSGFGFLMREIFKRFTIVEAVPRDSVGHQAQVDRRGPIMGDRDGQGSSLESTDDTDNEAELEERGIRFGPGHNGKRGIRFGPGHNGKRGIRFGPGHNGKRGIRFGPGHNGKRGIRFGPGHNGKRGIRFGPGHNGK